jgi:RecA/RadA recombinase
MAAKKEKKSSTSIEDLIKKHSALSGSQYEEFEGTLPVLSTGNLDFDLATGQIDPEHGNGGLRARDTMEIAGKPGNAKNVLLHSMIRTTQERWKTPNRNIVCVYTEKPDIRRMRREGIDVDRLIILGCYHKDIEARKTEASYIMEAIIDFCQNPEIKLVTVDSVAMLTTDAMDEKDLDEAQPVAALAKKFNIFVGRFVRSTAFAPLVYTNHYREAINTGFSFVPPSQLVIETVGGRTKEFLAMVRCLAIASPLWREQGGTKILHSETGKKIQDGLKTNYTIFRNRYANKDNYRVCASDYYFESCRYNNEEALIKIADHFTMSDESGVFQSVLSPGIVQRGATYDIAGEKFRGIVNAVQHLKDSPEVYKAIEKQCIARSADYFSDEQDFTPLDLEAPEDDLQ